MYIIIKSQSDDDTDWEMKAPDRASWNEPWTEICLVDITILLFTVSVGMLIIIIIMEEKSTHIPEKLDQTQDIMTKTRLCKLFSAPSVFCLKCFE